MREEKKAKIAHFIFCEIFPEDTSDRPHQCLYQFHHILLLSTPLPLTKKWHRTDSEGWGADLLQATRKVLHKAHKLPTRFQSSRHYCHLWRLSYPRSERLQSKCLANSWWPWNRRRCRFCEGRSQQGTGGVCTPPYRLGTPVALRPVSTSGHCDIGLSWNYVLMSRGVPCTTVGKRNWRLLCNWE